MFTLTPFGGHGAWVSKPQTRSQRTWTAASPHLLRAREGGRREFTKLIAQETEKWSKVIRTAGIKPE